MHSEPRKVFPLSAALWVLLGYCLCSGARGQAPAVSPADLPDSVRVLATDAATARDRGDLPGAIDSYRKALQTDPGWIDGWFLLGQLEYGTDQYEQARASLTHYLERTPSAPAALALRGLSEFELQAYEAALKDIQQALALGAANQPRNGQILLYHEALLLTRLGRFDEAVARYTAFIKQGIANPDVANGIALAGLQMPLLPRAIDPSNAQLIQLTGQAAILAITGDPASARAAFQAVLQQFPNRALIHYFCGYLLFTSSPDQAVEEFKAALLVNPKSPLAHAMLAWTAELHGDYAAALPEAEAAVASNPGLPLSQLVLGRALAETEDPAQALEHLDRVAQAQPGNLEAHLSLAKAYSKLGRKDDAYRERQLSLTLAGEGTAANANR